MPGGVGGAEPQGSPLSQFKFTFFHLDCLSSEVRLNVDFDLTLTVVAAMLYQRLADKLNGLSCNGACENRRSSVRYQPNGWNPRFGIGGKNEAYKRMRVHRSARSTIVKELTPTGFEPVLPA